MKPWVTEFLLTMLQKFHSLAGLVFVIFLNSLSTGAFAGDTLSIGWSSVDITPENSAMMRGGIRSTGVLDPITATVLALESSDESAGSSNRFILVSCDRQHITDGNRYPANMLGDVRALASRAVPEIEPNQIILMATHTHVAPSVQADPEYLKFASGKIAAGIEQAWKARRPGGISFGLGHAVTGHNRIATYTDGKSRMSGSFQKGSTGNKAFSHLEGIEDHSVHLLYTWDLQKKLTGVIVNIACPAQVQRGDKLSADFWHEAREMIRESLGADVHILPQLSAAGDIGTTVMVEKKAERRMQNLMFPDEADDRKIRRLQIGKNISEAVISVLPLTRTTIDFAPTLGHQQEIIPLTAGFPEPKKDTKPDFPVEINAVRLGEVAFVTNPFEFYLDYGMRIKGRSPATQTFVVQLTGSASYLPTEKAVSAGGYGAIPKTCVIGPAAGTRIVETSLELLEKLWSE